MTPALTSVESWVRSPAASPLAARRYRVLTDLGPARLSSKELPVALPSALVPVLNVPVDVAGGTVRITATSLGNPHCAVFMDAPPDDALLAALGAPLERHPLFPRRTNVEFVQVVSLHELRVRFWERGVGYTRASGTGAASPRWPPSWTAAPSRPCASCATGAPGSGMAGQRNVRQIGEVELLFEEWFG
jgi:hypothetical protein